MTSRTVLLAGLFAAAGLVSPVLAPGPKVDIAGLKGDCAVTIGGKTIVCDTVVYMHLKDNSRTNFQAYLPDGRVVAFSGGKDSQPRLTEYHLTLDRLLTGTEDLVAEAATGSCDVDLSESGEVIHSLVCRATTKSGLVELKFSGRRMP